MRFNEIVFNQLEPLFKKYGLKLVEEFKGYLKFKSDYVVITLASNEREKTNLLYVGAGEDTQYLVDGNVIKEYFISDVDKVFKIPELTIEDFVHNLLIFFKGAGKSLLYGEQSKLKELENSLKIKSAKYTTELIMKQNLNEADKAWQNADYRNFVRYLDKIDRDRLPVSYDLKYKIALDKLRG
jgi:hypothetical protein